VRFAGGSIELHTEKSEGFGRFHDEYHTVPIADIEMVEFPRKKWSQQNWLVAAGIVTGFILIGAFVSAMGAG
jgi:hypothetical protein